MSKEKEWAIAITACIVIVCIIWVAGKRPAMPFERECSTTYKPGKLEVTCR